MAITLDEIKAPVREELTAFEDRFRDAMRSDVALLDRVTHYIVKRKGKQVRPMFVFLSAKLFGAVNESTYNGASLVELLHTATLVHDDVVDDALERRGFFSINALWKNKVAVLVGDYLLSKGLLLAIDNDHVRLLRILSNSVREMSEGELLQMEKARRLDISEDIYFDIITKKTASLIASCCAIGAASVTEDEAVVERMRALGEMIGIAFQIKDDLFDYGEREIGKPRGIDIKERKMTLPLIQALSTASHSDRRRIIGIVKNQNDDNRKVREVIDFVKTSGGIEYAEERMYGFRDDAMARLRELPDVPARASLEHLLDYTIERTF